jgi:hypothetical protein
MTFVVGSLGRVEPAFQVHRHNVFIGTIVRTFGDAPGQGFPQN